MGFGFCFLYIFIPIRLSLRIFVLSLHFWFSVYFYFFFGSPLEYVYAFYGFLCICLVWVWVWLVKKHCWCGNNFIITILVSQSCDLILRFLIRFRGFAFEFYVYVGLHTHYTCAAKFTVSLLKNQTIVLKCMLHCHWNVYCKSIRSKCDSNKR